MDITIAMRLATCLVLIACGPSERPQLESVQWLVLDPYAAYQSTAVSPAGDVYLARIAADATDIWLAKRSHVDGSVEWTTTIANARMPHIATDHDGNLLVTGYAADTAWRAFAANYDPQGELIWLSTISLDGSCGLAIAGSPNGNVYVTGLAPSANGDHFVAALDAGGAPQWVQLYSSGDSHLAAIAANDSTVTITGDVVQAATFGSKTVTANQTTFSATYSAAGDLVSAAALAGGAGAPTVIDSQGGVAVLDGSGLASFDASGKRRWRISPIEATGIALAPADTLVTSVGDTLTVYGNDGSLLREDWLPFPDLKLAPLASGGYVFFGATRPEGNYFEGTYIAGRFIGLAE